jgi:hypothetical protein
MKYIEVNKEATIFTGEMICVVAGKDDMVYSGVLINVVGHRLAIYTTDGLIMVDINDVTMCDGYEKSVGDKEFIVIGG